MAALDFPATPADGEVYSAPNGTTYRWDEAAGLWLAWGAGTNNAIISSTPPANPTGGQLWWSNVLGQMFIFFVDANSSQWVPANPSVTLLMPPGSGADYFGGEVPIGWYLCDGSLKDRVIDAPLFTAIGETYGAGDGSTTFALPDCKGRVTAGKEETPTRLTVAGSGIDGSLLGETGGFENVKLTLAQMPSGVVSFQAYGPSYYQIGNEAIYPAYAADGAQATPLVQPILIVNKMIKR
jgi:hypothetical protein